MKTKTIISGNLSYNELAESIEKMTPEQRNQNVTMITDDEAFLVSGLSQTTETDVLDCDHIVLLVD